MVFLGNTFKSFDTCDEITLATHKPKVMKNMA